MAIKVHKIHLLAYPLVSHTLLMKHRFTTLLLKTKQVKKISTRTITMLILNNLYIPILQVTSQYPSQNENYVGYMHANIWNITKL